MPVEYGRVQKKGSSLVVPLPPPILRALGLQPQDRLAMRVLGNLLVMERVPMEKLARLRELPVSAVQGGR